MGIQPVHEQEFLKTQHVISVYGGLYLGNQTRVTAMDKYESAKRLERTTAMKSWNCQSCGMVIMSGDDCFRETIAPINPPPGMKFDSYCLPCGFKSTRPKS